MTLIEKKILKKAFSVIEEMKGEETLALDLRKLTAMTDYFLITSATNTRQVNAMAKKIEEQINDWYGVKPLHTEGLKNSSWVLMDYGFFILHIFLDEKRKIYNLEKIWLDAPRISIK
jgi:ribosome-associated protein